MKTRLLILIMAAALVGCRANKTAVTSREETREKLDYTEQTLTERVITIDSSKNEQLEITITEIEYFDPKEAVCEDEADTLLYNRDNDRETDVRGGNGPNNVKKYKQTVIRSNKNENNVKTEEETARVETTAQVETETQGETITETEPAKDPYRWRYIFGALVILVGLFFWLRRSGILKTILETFIHLFKF